MNNKSVILSVLLATTFLTPNAIAQTPAKSDGAVSYTVGSSSDYDFVINSTDANGELVPQYYKIDLSAAKLGTSYSLSDTEPADGTNYTTINLPDGTTKYLVYSGTPTNTSRLENTDTSGTDLEGDFAKLSIQGNAGSGTAGYNFGGAINNVNATIVD